MRKKTILFLSLFYFVFSTNLKAITVGGPTSVETRSVHHVFHSTDDAQGVAIFKSGFTILENATATWDSVGLVSSEMDIRNTATLRLNADLYLSSNMTLSCAPYGGYGYIRGEGHTIYLGGDLTISDTTSLVITNSGKYNFDDGVVIDGQGHSIILGHRSQLLIDGGVTLTLKNLTLKNSLNTFDQPAIRCLDWYSKLALDNVEIAFNDDFVFSNGQIFFNNDVVYTGTSTFIYRSVRPSYITQHSCLHFDPGTTFYYDTANGNVETKKDLIKMQDKTSSMFLDGCTLQTTQTNLRLTKGKLFFDNKVTLSTGLSRLFDGINRLSTQTTTAATNNTYSVAWHPNGQFLATGNDGQANNIYRWNGSTLTLITSTVETDNTNSVAWSPNGRFLAVGNLNQSNRIYSWNGSSLTLITSSFGVYNTAFFAWSPDGKFLAEANNNSTQTNKIYQWDGTSLTLMAETTSEQSDQTLSISWSPDGQFIAFGNNGSGEVNRIYRWNGSTLTLITSTTETDSTIALAWNPDGQFLAVGNSSGSGQVNRIYSWNGSSLTLITSTTLTDVTNSFAWSPDGQFIVAGNSTTLQESRIYHWNGSSLTLILSTTDGDNTQFVEWSPDGRFIAIANTSSQVNRIYKINYGYQPPSNSQIIFGNSSQGADYDLDAYVLASAHVELDGILNFDNLN